VNGNGGEAIINRGGPYAIWFQEDKGECDEGEPPDEALRVEKEERAREIKGKSQMGSSVLRKSSERES